MPHYKDGTVAHVGDQVRGKGYNFKAQGYKVTVPDGQFAEIFGTVVGIVPGSSSCNIQIAHVVIFDLDTAVPDYRMYHQTGVIGCGSDGSPKIGACLGLEYGQCDQFMKIG